MGSMKWISAMLLLWAACIDAQDWPRFRGPNGAGVAEAKNLPAEFGPLKNVLWKAPVPFGRSSPIVAGGRVFLTASDGDTLMTLAYDAATGRQLWRRDIKRTREHKVYRLNDAASPSPATDGSNVYVFFPDFGVAAYTAAGRESWRYPLGPFDSFYGMASSPIVAGKSVILLCDQTQGSFLLALDRASGKKLWMTPRNESPEGWAVPVVHEDQLLVFGSKRVDSYFLSTGEPRWWMPVSSHGSMGTPVIHEGSLIVTASGSDQTLLPAFTPVAAQLDKDKDNRLSIEECANEKEWFEHFGWVDADHDRFLSAEEWERARGFGVGDYGAMAIPMNGKGRMEPSSVRWRVKRGVSFVAAPVLYDGVFYMVKDGGIITSLDPATGAILKQGRTEQAPGQYLASPVAADGKVFLLNDEGKLTVLKAAPQWEILAVNNFDEETCATPAISGGRIFVRTRSTLYGFAGREPGKEGRR